MGNRLSKIYTRTGDDGSTGLGDGSRVPKENLRVEAYGTVDETNSAIGVILSVGGAAAADCALPHRGAARSVRSRRRIVHSRAPHDRRLPRRAARDRTRRIQRSFAAAQGVHSPGGGPAAAACHVARAVCRRAERRCWSLAREESVSPEALKYLNRLSDLLFVMARVLARHERGSEVVWRRTEDMMDPPA